MTHDEKKTLTVDGIEGDTARIEETVGHTRDVARKNLPADVQEGDILKEVNGKLEVDHAETRKVSRAAQGKLDQLNATTPSSPGKEIDL